MVTAASPVPAAFCIRYRNVKLPVKPALGMKVRLPFALTTSEPPVPNMMDVPAGNVVTAPPSVPSPNDVIVPAGMPSVSLARRPGAAMTSCVSFAPPSVSARGFGAVLRRTVIVAESLAVPLAARMRTTPFDTD